jgi:antitoxin (DNA-binding transcriptional repressor) of toxin-antitoxin stability system
MDKTLSVTDFVRNFSDYLNRVTYQGDRLVLTRGRKPVAEIRPMPSGRRLADLPSILNALPRLSDAEAAAFADDLAAARAELGSEHPHSPWDS